MSVPIQEIVWMLNDLFSDPEREFTEKVQKDMRSAHESFCEWLRLCCSTTKIRSAEICGVQIGLLDFDLDRVDLEALLRFVVKQFILIEDECNGTGIDVEAEARRLDKATLAELYRECCEWLQEYRSFLLEYGAILTMERSCFSEEEVAPKDQPFFTEDCIKLNLVSLFFNILSEKRSPDNSAISGQRGVDVVTL